MKRPKTGSTVKQYAYAMRKLNGQGDTKMDMARSVGYSPTVARNISTKIEKTEGYHNAVIELATKSNNMVLAVMHEFEARGLKDFSNKDLVSALNAISGAWEKFEKRRVPDRTQNPDENPLKKLVMNRIENQTIINNPAPVAVEAAASETQLTDDPFDF